MKITIEELRKMYHNRSVIFGKTFVVYSNGKTAKDTFRLTETTIHVDTDNNTVRTDCIRKTKSRAHKTPCCNFESITSGYSYGIWVSGIEISGIKSLYLENKEDVTEITLIGEYTSACFEIYN